MSITPSFENKSIETVRWGVIGAASFVANAAVIPAIIADPGSQLAAYATLSGGSGLPAERAGAKRFADYASLIGSGEVDAVYVALPNSLHLPVVSMAVAAGVPALCEKPLALDAGEVSAIAEMAAAHHVLVGEAYMTQFHLRDRKFRSYILDGGVGRIEEIEAEFTFELATGDNYRWKRSMGGGALLDVGIYLLDPILELAGATPRIDRVERKLAGDVDLETAVELSFDGGLGARVLASFVRPERQRLRTHGTLGAVEMENPFTPGPSDTDIRVERNGEESSLSTLPSNPYGVMVSEFAASVRDGTPFRRPLDRSLAVARLLSQIAATR